MTHGRLVVPEGLIIDELARERLTRQIQRQPPEVQAVAAEVGDLPSGASYRVHAEWRSLEPLAACVPAPDGPIRGAVLVRPDVGFEVTDGRVSVDGAVVLDQGAHSHDPWSAVGPLQAASEAGRPPFPRRPVVIFAAAGAIPDDLGDWARRMVNRLVRREVEGRLALATSPAGLQLAGLQLTRPCLANGATVRALAPDAIVTLDADAAGQVADWCGSDRSTVVIELVDDLTITQRLVSWQIARARGRVRAQISRRIGAPALAALVGRLCAGPQPMPPTDAAAVTGPSVRVRENWGGGAPRATCVVVTDSSAAAARRPRTEGLTDQLEAAGVGVVGASLGGGLPAGAETATVVVLSGVRGSGALTELIEARAARRLATVLDVDPADVSAGGDGSVVVAPDVARLAVECRYVVTPTEAVRAALAGLQVRALVLPTMLTRERALALRSAGAAAERRHVGALAGGALGWRVGSAGEPVPDYLNAVAEGIAKLLADRVDVRAEVVGDANRVSAALRRHDRVAVHETLPPGDLGGWALQVWSPRLVGGEVVDDPAALIEAGFAGVPTVFPAAARGAMDGAAASDLEVSRHDEPEAWTTVLQTLLDANRALAGYGAEARRWAQAVHGASVCRASVNRLLGWASYKVKR